MSGKFENLSYRQEAAIQALLTSETQEAAAAVCHLAPGTLRRWMKEAAFQEAYAAARRELYQAGLLGLQHAVQDAVQTLKASLSSTSESLRIRAAVAILDHAYRAAELVDIEARLARLEAQRETKPS